MTYKDINVDFIKKVNIANMIAKREMPEASDVDHANLCMTLCKDLTESEMVMYSKAKNISLRNYHIVCIAEKKMEGSYSPESLNKIVASLEVLPDERIEALVEEYDL